MTTQYEDMFGVKVDIRIPEIVRAGFYNDFESFKLGKEKGFLSLVEDNLQTEYEVRTVGEVLIDHQIHLNLLRCNTMMLILKQ